MKQVSDLLASAGRPIKEKERERHSVRIKGYDRQIQAALKWAGERIEKPSFLLELQRALSRLVFNLETNDKNKSRSIHIYQLDWDQMIASLEEYLKKEVGSSTNLRQDRELAVALRDYFLSRSEVRKVTSLVIQSVLNPQGIQASDSERAAHEIFVLVKALEFSGFITALNQSVRNMLKKRSELWLTPKASVIDIETYRQESQALVSTLRTVVDFPEQMYTVGLALPENETRYGSESFTRDFLKALGASIDTVIVTGKVTSDFSKQFKLAGKHIRPLRNLNQPVMVPGQPVIPLGVLDSPSRNEVRLSRMDKAFLPIWIDLEGIEDPLVRDYTQQLQAVALVHAVKILGEKPELLKNRSEFRAELRKRLAISGKFDSMITLDQKQGQLGVTISGILAQAFLQHRAEVRLQSAA